MVVLEVPDVIDVPVSPSSVVTEFRDGFSCCSDGEFVEPPFFSFSKKRSLCCTVTQEEMRYESSQVKAPPLIGRMMPPTPLQSSYSSFEGEQGHSEVWHSEEEDRLGVCVREQLLQERNVPESK